MKSSPRKRNRGRENDRVVPNLRLRWPIVLGFGICSVATLLIWQRPWRHRAQTLNSAPPSKELAVANSDGDVFATYAGSESCKQCHLAEYDRWAQSHHGFAERMVRPAVDKIAFDPPRTFHHGTQNSESRIEGGEYQVVTTGLSGKREPQTVRRVIGVDPLRQFLVDGIRGRMQALEVAYEPNRNQWFDVYGNEDRQPGEWGHWTGRGMTWNAQCAACHNTRVRKNYDERSDSYNTRMAEISVGCEACHGPMKGHVASKRDAGTRGRGDAAKGQIARHANIGSRDSTLVHLSREQVIDTCGSCHAREGELTGDFVPGESFFDHYSLTGVDESDNFYPDGQIHEEDYEFSAFLGSKMHAAGVSCVDCHDVHSGKTILQGNALCMRCHVGAFPKAPIINPFTHTFHKPDSAGSQCINCHMPVTPYMQRHNRHDHGFTTPDPLLTKQIGVPNACNRCHTDKDADWALTSANAWYGAKMQRPSRQRAITIASARKGDDSARPALLKLLGDPGQTFYWRSTFVRLLGRWANDPATLAALLSQLHADHPMVRESAVMALGQLAGQQPAIAQAINGLLSDSSRNVRIAAAQVLGADVDPNSRAGGELLVCLNRQSDQPMGQLQLAMYAAARHDVDQAIEHLKRTVDWDKRSPALRREAAVLYGTLGRPDAALAQIEEACRLEPGNAEYALMRGLAASEVGKPREAMEAMRKAVQLDPHFGRAWYNLAMAERNAGNFDAALNAFQNAEAADPKDAEIPYTRALMLVQLNRLAEARAAAEHAVRIRPDYPEALDLLRQLPP